MEELIKKWVEWFGMKKVGGKSVEAMLRGFGTELLDASMESAEDQAESEPEEDESSGESAPVEVDTTEPTVEEMYGEEVTPDAGAGEIDIGVDEKE
jgi:hypothetical protein